MRSKSELTGSGLRFTRLRPTEARRGHPAGHLQRTKYALGHGWEVLYITEAAVFCRTPEGIVLKGIAPGLDLERDIVPQMGFRPRVTENLKTTPAAVYQEPLLRMTLFPNYS